MKSIIKDQEILQRKKKILTAPKRFISHSFTFPVWQITSLMMRHINFKLEMILLHAQQYYYTLLKKFNKLALNVHCEYVPTLKLRSDINSKNAETLLGNFP